MIVFYLKRDLDTQIHALRNVLQAILTLIGRERVGKIPILTVLFQR